MPKEQREPSPCGCLSGSADIITAAWFKIMQAADYEKMLLAATTWQLAVNSDINELLAIACTIRNWVVPRYGVQRLPMNGKAYFKSYSEAAETFLALYPTRPLPAITEPALIDQDDGLLVMIDGVYDCTTLDLTSSRAFPGGARYFGRGAIGTHRVQGPYRDEVLQHQDIHPLIGTFGSQQFYA